MKLVDDGLSVSTEVDAFMGVQMCHHGGGGHLDESTHQQSMGVKLCHQRIKHHEIRKVKTCFWIVFFLHLLGGGEDELVDGHEVVFVLQEVV